MSLLDFSRGPLWLNAAIFATAAVIVWRAGYRLTGYVDLIARRTGLGHAFLGMLLLGGITSLPEVAAVTTSAWTGNAALATNNLLGSVAINLVLIAVADAVLGRDALTSVVPSAGTMLQGTLGILALALLTTAVLTGDLAVFGIGLWSSALLIYCVFAFWLAKLYSKRQTWQAAGEDAREDLENDGEGPSDPGTALSKIVVRTGAAAVVILGAGFALSQSADAIASQTGLSAGLVGLVLVGFATSLPELSSVTAAVRLGRYEMALGDIFGTNLLTIALIFLADAVYHDGPVLNEAGQFEAVAALLGLILTAIFLVGLLERQNRTMFRMGYDAAAALGAFAAGLVLLYFLSG